MTRYPTLQINRDPRGVLNVALNAPDKRNALSAQMIADLTDLAADLAADPSVRVVVMSGIGRVFCAGGDLDWMQAQIRADRATRMAQATKLAQMLRPIRGLGISFNARSICANLVAWAMRVARSALI
jgi:methylglutaconyl-CoA hydratase